MKTSSAKGKGRQLQQYVARALAKKHKLTYGVDEDFSSRPMGCSGVDVVMSKEARKVCCYDIECKRVEKFISVKLRSALEQSMSNCAEGRVPLLVFRENRDIAYAVLPFEDLLELV